jgi:hypothetical protein
LKTQNHEWAKEIGGAKTVEENHGICTLRVPKRSEVIVRIPVENGVEGADGLIETTEITEGVYVASSLIRLSLAY